MKRDKGTVTIVNRVLVFIATVLLVASCSPPGPTAISESQRQAIGTLVGGVDRASLEALMSDFSSNRNAWQNPSAVIAVQNAIEARLVSYGYGEVMRRSSTVQGLNFYNPETKSLEWKEGPFTMDSLFADKAGADPDFAPVLIGAHHDTVPGSPGADDNGSGCAGVLETARVLAGASFERTIRFCFFAFEEEGMVGSRDYAKSLSAGQLPDSVIVLEMIGFTAAKENSIPLSDSLLGLPATGDFIGAMGARESRSLVLDFLAAAAEFSPGLRVFGSSTDSNLGSDPFLRSVLRSDHEPFMSMGVPAIIVSDTAELRDGSPYHQAQDGIPLIDFAFMTSVTKAAAAATAIRAGIR
jgi:hypothetical protein